jgi:hypothetical protein
MATLDHTAKIKKPRGGSWIDNPSIDRSANRGGNILDYYRDHYGFAVWGSRSEIFNAAIREPYQLIQSSANRRALCLWRETASSRCGFHG